MSKLPGPTPEETAYIAELRDLLGRMPPSLMIYIRTEGSISCGSAGELSLMKPAPGGAVGIDKPIIVRCA